MCLTELMIYVFSRYIAVCAPFFRLRHNIKARFYILPILLFAPLYNVPRFFEFTTINNTTYTCLDNSTFGPSLISDPKNEGSLFDPSRPRTDLDPQLFPSYELEAEESGLVLLEQDFLGRSNDELREMCKTWKKKVVIELHVTDFRVDPIYVSVSIFTLVTV